MKTISLPKMNDKLAEFLGICFGDGCLSVDKKNCDYSLTIVGHLSHDYSYLKNYVRNLIEVLFQIEPKFRIQRNNTLALVVRSKILVYFLHENGMPIGKKNQLYMPDKIKKSRNLVSSFVRGFFDTDGTLTFKKKKDKYNYPVLSIASKNEGIIEEVKAFLIENNFIIGKTIKETKSNIDGKLFYSYRIFLNGKSNLNKWLDLIGFSNHKHKNKYLVWKEKGYIPYFLLDKKKMTSPL